MRWGSRRWSLSHDSLLFIVVVALSGALIMAANFLIAQPLFAILDGQSIKGRLRSMRELIVPIAVNIALVAVIAKIYASSGLARLSSCCSTSWSSPT